MEFSIDISWCLMLKKNFREMNLRNNCKNVVLPFGRTASQLADINSEMTILILVVLEKNEFYFYFMLFSQFERSLCYLRFS